VVLYCKVLGAIISIGLYPYIFKIHGIFSRACTHGYSKSMENLCVQRIKGPLFKSLFVELIHPWSWARMNFLRTSKSPGSVYIRGFLQRKCWPCWWSELTCYVLWQFADRGYGKGVGE
jgi:hypothetical protein